MNAARIGVAGLVGGDRGALAKRLKSEIVNYKAAFTTAGIKVQ